MEKDFFYFLTESYFKYNILYENSTDEKKELFKILKESYHIQAENLLKEIIDKNYSMDVLLSENENILNHGFEKFKNSIFEKRYEKYVVWSENIKKMEQMLLINSKEDTPKNLYVCKHCGWIGSDEIPEKCPLCAGELKKVI